MDLDQVIQRQTEKLSIEHPHMKEMRESLVVLKKALDTEAALKPIGRLLAQSDIKRMIRNNFEIHQYSSEHAEVKSQRIEKPVFIIGMPRTGSSFLHNLMACDDRWRAPMYWETLYPCPPTAAGSPSPSRVRAANRDFAFFHVMAPDYRKIYMYGARRAAECIAIMAMQFESPRFSFTYRIPSYWNWTLDHGLQNGYQFESLFLKMLQSKSQGLRWLLKAPAHMIYLDSLLSVFPDARLIFTHRHPARVIPSIASNTWTLRKVFSNANSKEEVGQEELKRWLTGWSNSKNLRNSPMLPADRFTDVLYDDLMSDPMYSIGNIYKSLGMDLTPAIEQKMAVFMERNKTNKHGKHEYTAEEYGLDNDRISDLFSDYTNEFGL